MIQIKMPALHAALFSLSALLFGVAASAQQPQPQLPLVQLSAGMHLIKAEVAQTPEQRATGMMFRKTMGANDGMIFVFDDPATQCFWMQNTLLPLSVAFVADDGSIVNLDEMKPLTQASHCSTKPVRFVLEMNTGWFTKRGIAPGFKLQGKLFKP